MHRSFTKYLFIAIIFLFNRCAQIVVPGGGPKDKQPPVAVRYIPDSAALEFKAKNIIIEFDEYIQLVGLQKELVISPPMKYQPDIKVRGRQLLISIRDTLKKNVTYTINFGKSLCDFTESNASKGFQYIFSTGTFIDTLTFSGKVTNAFTAKPEVGALVMLYEDHSDSVPMKSIPSYFTRTGDGGNFKIGFLPAGKYKSFVLKDENGDYKYNLPKEYIGFSDTLFTIQKHARRDFVVFNERPHKQKKLSDFVRGYGHVYLAYALPVKDLKFKALNAGTKTETFITEYNLTLDTAKVWFPDFGNDSLHFEVIADGTIKDTIKICTCLFDQAKRGRGEKFGMRGKSLVPAGGSADLNKAMAIEFNHPISSKLSKYEQIVLEKDSVKIPVSIEKNGLREIIIRPSNTDSMNPDWVWTENANYKLFIPPGAVKDIFGNSNDSLLTSFKSQEEKYYGTLTFSVTVPDDGSSYIFQMLDSRKAVVKEESIRKTKKLQYDFLPPGLYGARLIEDKNEDGKWNTGDYSAKQDPEPIVYYGGEINIRSNWDLESDWKYSKAPIKQEAIKNSDDKKLQPPK